MSQPRRIIAAAGHSGMHFTDTAEHFHVIEGEVVLAFESGDVVLRRGDLGVCRGAEDGWSADYG
ncbi:MAG: cupin domain-containing protein [Novosphingobium sp.]